MRYITFLLFVLATTTATMAQAWQYDLGILDHKSATETFVLTPGKDAVASVVVKNHSSNTSMPYTVQFLVDGRLAGTASCTGLGSGQEKEHVIHLLPPAGAQPAEARISLSRQPTGSSNRLCPECQARRSCNWLHFIAQTPGSGAARGLTCTKGTRKDVCSCHVFNDNPLNSVHRVAVQVGGASATASAPQGVDLVVDDTDTRTITSGSKKRATS